MASLFHAYKFHNCIKTYKWWTMLQKKIRFQTRKLDLFSFLTENIEQFSTSRTTISFWENLVLFLFLRWHHSIPKTVHYIDRNSQYLNHTLWNKDRRNEVVELDLCPKFRLTDWLLTQLEECRFPAVIF